MDRLQNSCLRVGSHGITASALQLTFGGLCMLPQPRSGMSFCHYCDLDPFVFCASKKHDPRRESQTGGGAARPVAIYHLWLKD